MLIEPSMHIINCEKIHFIKILTEKYVFDYDSEQKFKFCFGY